jgi:hypothetical protein
MAVKKKNNKLLIGLGIAGALVGIGIFTYPSLKKLFKPDEDKLPPDEQQKQNNLPPGDQNNNTKEEESTLVKDPTIDITKKVKKGSVGKEATAIQTIINLISQLRGTYGKTLQIDGKSLKLPIGIDGDFGDQSRLGALYAFPTYKDKGYITLYTARKKFAYATGYYDKGFPSNLIGTAKESDYRNSYTLGKADGVKKEITDNFWKF